MPSTRSLARAGAVLVSLLALPGGVGAAPAVCRSELPVPSTAQICAGRWSVIDAKGGDPALGDRAACVTAPDGATVLGITAHANEANSLIQSIIPVPEAGDYRSVRASVRFMLPADFQAWDGGRLAFGVFIGEPVCASGGCAPENQRGAMIRAQFKKAPNGSITLQNYSYHLDRQTPTRLIDSPLAGQGEQEATWGAGRDMQAPLPRGQWVTMTLDVTLNDPGVANGSSTLSAYDAKGHLIGTAAFDNVTYRPDASWHFGGLVMTEKYTHLVTKQPTRTQTMLYRDYRLQGCAPLGDG